MYLFNLSGITQDQFLTALQQSSEEELIAINKMVVNTLKQKREVVNQSNLINLQLGDSVWFEGSRNRGRIEGTLVKKNRKTAVIRTEEGHRWKVTACLLQKV